MFRRPLRTKSGCDRCKRRRKKCDENKPTCNNCSRLNFLCTWTAAQTGVSIEKSVVPVGATDRGWPESVDIKRVPRTVREAVWDSHGLSQGYHQFRDQTQFDLTAWSPTALQGLVSRSAAPEFNDTSMLMTLALQNPWVRDALAAFSAYSLLTLSRGNQKWENVAIVMYQQALSAVRSHIAAAWNGAHSLETLVAITFLGLSESLGSGNAARAVTHFSAAAAICKAVPFASVESEAGRKLYRIAVECWLYNLATLAIFHEHCDSIVRCVDWSVLDTCFLASATPNDWALDRSPFIGGNHGIYKLMLQLTCLARKRAPLSTRQALTSAWSVDLDDFETRLGRYFSHLPREVARLYHSKFLLHIYAIRIFLEKVANHVLDSSSPVVLSHVRRAQDIFRSQPIHETRNPALAWPLIIFLCAADKESTFDFFRKSMHNIHQNFDAGHARRMNAVVAIIRSQRVGNAGSLDLLLCERGILMPDDSRQTGNT